MLCVCELREHPTPWGLFALPCDFLVSTQQRAADRASGLGPALPLTTLNEALSGHLVWTRSGPEETLIWSSIPGKLPLRELGLPGDPRDPCTQDAGTVGAVGEGGFGDPLPPAPQKRGSGPPCCHCHCSIQNCW